MFILSLTLTALTGFGGDGSRGGGAGRTPETVGTKTATANSKMAGTPQTDISFLMQNGFGGGSSRGSGAGRDAKTTTVQAQNLQDQQATNVQENNTQNSAKWSPYAEWASQYLPSEYIDLAYKLFSSTQRTPQTPNLQDSMLRNGQGAQIVNEQTGIQNPESATIPTEKTIDSTELVQNGKDGAIISEDKTGNWSMETSKFKAGSLSNFETRKWYLEQEAKIPELINNNASLEEQAKQAFNLRNQFRTEARYLMSDRKLADALNITDPNRTWEEMVKIQIDKGFKGDDIYRKIIESSQRSRTSINQILGLG
ncbi:MAG: hypothetical protein LUG13_03730 [Oscillospiraceae bacterium]|nr:hypothetical protein [Oscillospiraceae bacterium]